MSILTRVQANPLILTANATYVADLIERCKSFIVSFCRLEEYPESDTTLDDICVSLVEQKYRQLGLEGLHSGSIPGGVSFTAFDIDPIVLTSLLAKRKF